LCDGLDDACTRERRKHDIEKSRSEWTLEDEWGEGEEWGYVIAEPWKYVEEVINSLINGDVREVDSLEEVLGVVV
jgi:hypothetical protein